jgi:hypothetical protein
MKRKFAAATAISLLLAASGFAHRLDEYLQATIFTVEKDRVQGSMRLVPGVAVSSVVLGGIDANGDGAISQMERQGYAKRVLHDLSLSVDGERLTPELVSVSVPNSGDMKQGLGEIKIDFTAALPAGGSHRKLIFENHHQGRISAYLVNCLVPADKDIQITAQNRNYNQSFYQLDYAQTPGLANSPIFRWWSDFRGSPGDFGGFFSMFHLGMRHIAEGTDHLLFLLTLLLPAPLMVAGSRWAGFGGARHSLLQILRVVTAFTVGHSITLALAAVGLVRVPSRPIEVLIAVSILVSAVHALRPIFAGREAGIAAFFGLIHGLAFAATLGDLGLGWWDRIASILAFNLGIEAMQLVVVAAFMPSLVLLSRTRAYSGLRIGGALFAGLAAVGWIAERLFNLHKSVDVVVDVFAHHAEWIALALFLTSLACWAARKVLDSERTFPAGLPEFKATLRSSREAYSMQKSNWLTLLLTSRRIVQSGDN